MSERDPFFNSGGEIQTVMRPSPGGRKRQTPSLEPSVPPRRWVPAESSLPAGFDAGANPITTSALPLLMVVPKLRKLAFHNAIGDLQERLVGEIVSFKNRSLQRGASEKQVQMASYFICSVIDEAVLNTPWGNESNWGHDSLLVRFHQETFGGEAFFDMLDRLMQQPNQQLDLIELAYLCISLGFEGKYRLSPNGLRELELLRQEIYSVIQRFRGEPNRSLSVNWQGLRDLRSPLTKYVPLWVVAVVSCLLLLVVYLGFSFAISRASNGVYAEWMALSREGVKPRPEPVTVVTAPIPIPEVVAPAPSRTIAFNDLLSDEIRQGMVQVLDGPILRLTNAFQSGSDQIKKNYYPLLEKIAQVLKNENRYAEVIGHTDNKPIFTARFHSNWDLSNARAKSVASILDPSGALGERITYKGRAETDPIVPNDTPEHLAINRRIDIHIR